MNEKSGIYCITSPSSKKYIGSAVDFKKRWAVHNHHLKNGTHHSKHLQAAWDKYCGHGFVFEKIVLCEVKDLILYEQICIDFYRPEYNILKFAGKSRLGTPHSEASKLKMSATRKLKMTDEMRKKLSVAAMGKESAFKGKTHTIESNKKNSDAQKLLMTVERRKAIGDVHRGKKLSEWQKKRVGDSARGRIKTPEELEKLRAANLGKKLSEEQKRKISIARTGSIVLSTRGENHWTKRGKK